MSIHWLWERLSGMAGAAWSRFIDEGSFNPEAILVRTDRTRDHRKPE